MRATYLKTFAICAILSPILALAQDTPAGSHPTHYELVYRLLQIGADGKVSGSHSYSTIVVADDPHASPSQIRNEDKVPIVTGTVGDANNTQYQYQTVGTNIDTTQASMHNGQLRLGVFADSSAIARTPADAHILAPIIRHLSWRSNVVVTLEKPTILFTSDNMSNTGKTELELTATEIK